MPRRCGLEPSPPESMDHIEFKHTKWTGGTAQRETERTPVRSDPYVRVGSATYHVCTPAVALGAPHLGSCVPARQDASRAACEEHLKISGTMTEAEVGLPGRPKMHRHEDRELVWTTGCLAFIHTHTPRGGASSRFPCPVNSMRQAAGCAPGRDRGVLRSSPDTPERAVRSHLQRGHTEDP